jgi:hypothetical protein
MRHPTYSQVTSTLALVVALGGTAYAAGVLPANSVGTPQLKNAAVTGAKLHAAAVDARAVAPNALGGGQIEESRLATVPRAHVAVNAGNAARLGGRAAATYLDGCPTGTRGRGDVCFEETLRAEAPFALAVKACSLAGLRIPTIGELGAAFDQLGAPQERQWVDGYYFADSTSSAAVMSESAARAFQFNVSLSGVARPYRCVTTATSR